MILDLQAVKSYIDEQIQAMPTNEAGKLTIGTLLYIQPLIEQYQKSYNPAHLYETLRLIECIQISDLRSSFSSIFSNPDMRQFLIGHNFTVLTRPHQSDEVRKYHNIQHALPRFAEPILGAIYKKISNDLKKNQIVWFHSFAADANGEIMNEEIRDWKAYMTRPLSENPTLAHRDFTRDVQLGDNDPKALQPAAAAAAAATTTTNNDDPVTVAIKQFVAPSSYHTSENHDDKALICAWLSARGGQEMNSFISHMIVNSRAFDIPQSQLCEDKRMIPSMRADAKLTRWTLDENGQATFNLDYQIKTIQFSNVSALLKCADGATREVSTDSDEFASSNENIRHLVSIACKVRLDIDREHNVIPKVVSFVVVSYTDALKPAHGNELTTGNQRRLEHRNSAPL